MPTTKSNECTRYEVREVVRDDYGVYAHYKYPEPHEELLIICRSRKNAELLKFILDCDSSGQVCSEFCVDELLDTANGNILGYVDDRYHPKVISFDQDNRKSFSMTLLGLGRITKLSEREILTIRKMKATDEVVISRKLGPIRLWTSTIR